LTRLNNVPLFASVTPEALALVAGLVTRRSYAKDSFLCKQGQLGETLYVIDFGEAIIHQQNARGAQRPVGYLRAGDYFGEDALLLGTAYNTSVQATTDVEALCIHKHEFDHLHDDHPHIRDQLIINQRNSGCLQVPQISWQDEDEKTVLVRKRHWFVFVRDLRLPFLTLLVLGFTMWLLRWLNVIISPLASFLFIGAVPSIMALCLLIDWQNDYYSVTTRRLLHREKAVLMSETLQEILLAKIQATNITRELIGKMLGFGTLQIYTTTARGNMILDYLPDPEGMRDVIANQVVYLNLKLQQEERDRIRRELLRQTRRADTLDKPHTSPPSYQKRSRRESDSPPPAEWLRQRLYDQTDQIIWRKHWVYLIARVYLPVSAVLILTAFIAISAYRWPTRYGPYLLPLSLVLWIVSIIWLWWQVEDWRNDIYVLTDRLIIDVEKKPLFFSDERTQATLDMIQNVSLRIPGLLAGILNYGDVLIETAGPTGVFTFDGVSHPADVQREIFRRIEVYNDAERRRQRDQRIAEFSDWFQAYHQSNEQQQPPDTT